MLNFQCYRQNHAQYIPTKQQDSLYHGHRTQRILPTDTAPSGSSPLALNVEFSGASLKVRLRERNYRPLVIRQPSLNACNSLPLMILLLHVTILQPKALFLLPNTKDSLTPPTQQECTTDSAVQCESHSMHNPHTDTATDSTIISQNLPAQLATYLQQAGNTPGMGGSPMGINYLKHQNYLMAADKS